MICSIDTCFLIDWTRYSRRKLLLKVFDYCYIVDEVLNEIRSENTIVFISELLARGFLVFYPFRREIASLVRELVETSIRDPRIRTLDPPEAYALAIGIRENAIVLTENRGVLNLVKLYPKYSASVWRSYELLQELFKRGLIEDIDEEIKRYEGETRHKFSRIHRR